MTNLWIEGFYFDSQMYYNKENPRFGSYPNSPEFRDFVHTTSEEAFNAVHIGVEAMRELGRKIGQEYDEYAMKLLLGS